MDNLTIRRAASSDVERIVELGLLLQEHAEKSNSLIWRITEEGKRQYLENLDTMSMFRNLNEYFSMKVEIPRIRHGKSQEIETLINEEASLLSMFLRNEKQSWRPRIARPSDN
jgi:hypothetical protein